MKKKMLVAATTLAMLVPSLSHQALAQTNESNITVYEKIQASNLTDEEKNQLTKDGKVIQALDPAEVEKALGSKRIEITSEEGEKTITFDDGSAIVVSLGTSANPALNSDPESIQTAKYTGKVTGALSYKIVSWTGVTLLTYTMFQDAVTDGTRLTSFEPSPYSAIKPTPILNLWELVAEIPTNRASGTGCVATMNPKFKFGVSDFISFDSLNIKGTLIIKGDGNYSGYWENLDKKI